MSNTTLIATLGGKPQLITLALDALLLSGIQPQTVVVVHTRHDRPETAAALTHLRAEFSTTYTNTPLKLLELKNATGPLADVTAPIEVEVAFRSIYAEVRAAKLTDQNVHLLIAGGRRTLSVFGMAVAQMLFDDHDRLWHLASHPALEESGNLHAGPDEWARLIPIPVMTWGQLSPVFNLLRDVDDPFLAAERLQARQLRERLDDLRAFVLGSLSGAEQRVVELLVREGWSDVDLGQHLSLSPKTVEQHLRAAYRKAALRWDLENLNRTQLVALLSLYYHLPSGKAPPGKNRENPG